MGIFAEIELCESTDVTKVRFLFVGLDEQRGLREKGGYTRRIAGSHFECYCQHKDREDQLRRVTKCTEVDGKKAVPLQAWSGPKCSRKLRFPDFMTTAQDGGKVVSLTHRPPLPPGNAPGTHLC